MIWLALLVVVISFHIYGVLKWKKQLLAYYAERNLKCSEPKIIKGIVGLFFGRTTMYEATKKQYTEFPDQTIIGLAQSSKPQFSLRDPEVIKKIVVKDFEFFQDHTPAFDPESEPLFGNSLIALTGEKWHRMRATLSPAFTGSKMRQMFELVSEYADEAINLLLQKSKDETLDLEMKDVFSRFTNDIIATCAFGLKVSSIAEPENDFFMKSKKLMLDQSWLKSMKFIFIVIAPKLAKSLDIHLFDKAATAEFTAMILDTMDARRKQNIHRPDMINLLMQVRDGTLTQQGTDENISSTGLASAEESDHGKRPVDRNWSDEELVGQCFFFFSAGFETVSDTLTFSAYEIMANPEVQQKLYQEISETNERLNGKRIPYDELQKLAYLDQFISEVLRKWPPAFQTERVCVKDYQYGDSDRKFTIEKGQSVFIPLYGLHHDEQYFPEPDKFDPERFSDENKSNIVPGSYLPFGLGPRNCIGSRFALMEVKGILYYLVLNFLLEQNDETVIPLKMALVPRFGIDNGLHLKLRPRH